MQISEKMCNTFFNVLFVLILVLKPVKGPSQYFQIDSEIYFRLCLKELYQAVFIIIPRLLKICLIRSRGNSKY